MNVFFVVPGLSEKYQSGGLMVLQTLRRLFEKLSDTTSHFLTTHDNHPKELHAEDAAKILRGSGEKANPEKSYFIVSWGPLVADHIKLIRSHIPAAQIIFYAQSFGWGVKIPEEIPIVCVSRSVADQWRKRAPQNPCRVISPPLSEVFHYAGGARDIDILVHTRKQNSYCLEKLVPALLEKAGSPDAARQPNVERPPNEAQNAGVPKNVNVKILDRWIPQEEFAALLKRAKIFLYITAPHTHGRFFKKTFAEGFGLPALEAVASGALVGSNLLGGVNDFLEPGQNCIELGNNNAAHGAIDREIEIDLAKITTALNHFSPNRIESEKIAARYSEAAVLAEWHAFLQEIKESFMMQLK